MTVNLPHTYIQLQEIDETTNILSDAVTILNDDLQRLHIESSSHRNALDSLTKDFSKQKIPIQEQNTLIDGTSMNQETLQQDLALMGQKINDMKACSYDGTLIWKITNVQEKIGQQLMFFLTCFQIKIDQVRCDGPCEKVFLGDSHYLFDYF
jgi:chromosome segregation ATPase